MTPILTFLFPISSKIIQISLDTNQFETFSHPPHLCRHLYHLHETSKLFPSYDNSYDCFSRGIERKKLFRTLSSCRTPGYKRFLLRVWNCTSRHETMSDDTYKKGWKGWKAARSKFKSCRWIH